MEQRRIVQLDIEDYHQLVRERREALEFLLHVIQRLEDIERGGMMIEGQFVPWTPEVGPMTMSDFITSLRRSRENVVAIIERGKAKGWL
jgi:hypothetical protein